MHTLKEFWCRTEDALIKLGLPEADRDALLKVGVELQLERMILEKRIFNRDVQSIAEKIFFQAGSSGKLIAELGRQLIAPARNYSVSRKLHRALGAVTLAINNCSFGDLDEGFGRFESFGEAGLGIASPYLVTPEGKLGTLLLWSLAALAEFHPVRIEAVEEGYLSCSIKGYEPIEISPTSTMIGRGALISWPRLWELGQAGLYNAYFGTKTKEWYEVDRLFLRYPIVITGRLENWDNFLAALASSSLAWQFKYRRDWLTEAGISAAEIKRVMEIREAVRD